MRTEGISGARVLRCRLSARCAESSWEETAPKPKMQNLHPTPSTPRLHLSPDSASPPSIVHWTKQHPPVSPRLSPLPFSLAEFAFQDKNKEKQLPTCLGNFELLESDVQVTDDFMYSILCQGGLFFWKNEASLRESYTSNHVIHRGKRLSRRRQSSQKK